LFIGAPDDEAAARRHACQSAAEAPGTLFGGFANTPAFTGKVGFGRAMYGAAPGILAFAEVNGERSPRQ
jgi:hypothetical protein